MGELIKFLIFSVDGSPELAKWFYDVGDSLGAQTAGYAENYLKARPYYKYFRGRNIDSSPWIPSKIPNFKSRITQILI